MKILLDRTCEPRDLPANLPLDVAPSDKDAVVIEAPKDPSDVDVKPPSDPPIVDTSDALQSCPKNSYSEKSSSTQPIVDDTCRELFPDLSKADKRETSHDEPKTKKQRKVVCGLCLEVGGVSNPIEIAPRCCRCKSPVEVGKYRVVGKTPKCSCAIFATVAGASCTK